MLESLIREDDHPKVLGVSDHPSDGLVDGSSGLLVVPVIARKNSFRFFQFEVLAFSLQVIFFENNLSIRNLRERYPDNDDASRRIIRKVKALTNSASTDPHKYSSFLVTFKNGLIVLAHDLIVKLRITWLLQ